MSHKKKIVIGVIAMVVIGGSFYGGMEYQSYRIRSAMTKAVTDIGKAFGEGFSNAGSGKDINTAKVPEPVINKLNDKITVELVDKDFSEIDYQSYNVIKLKFINNTGKEVKGVRGDLVLSDIFGDKIKSANVSYDDGLAVGETKNWTGQLYYNQFDNDDKKLKATDLANLKYKWNANAIVYQDGTTETSD